MKDAATRSLQRPGAFEPARRDKGWIEGVYPSTLLVGVCRRPSDRSPCFVYLRCWPDGTHRFDVAEHSPTARAMIAREGP